MPYANGPIHLGHLVEYLQTDIWARFQRMRGHDCAYVCADDAHGTPIMLTARGLGIDPEELIRRVHAEHLADFTDFGIEFDEYYTTHSEENRHYSTEIFEKLRAAGHIVTRPIEQFWCEHDRMFLPDRFIRGGCPRCAAADQYGDSCEVCSATYEPSELVNPGCAICGNPPVVRSSDHLFVRLSDFTDQLRSWLAEDRVHPSVARKLEEWFRDGLRDWDITRDGPYFGFPIPGEDDKYFYVWLDAPVGYMAATQKWCDRVGRSFDDYWRGDAEIYHFIGKDIVYFHLLFWPAMLMGAGFRTPQRVFVHGFLTVDGQKMSKSRGTFVRARTYLDHLDPQYLRYYYACRLSSGLDDIDLNSTDFVERVNSDLLGKVVNLGSRAAGTPARKLGHRLGSPDPEGAALLDAIAARGDEIAGHYESLEYGRAMRAISAAADEANRYFNDQRPWDTVKTNPDRARPAVTAAVDAFRMLTLYLKPVLPRLAADVEELLGIEPLKWTDIDQRLRDREIRPYHHLMRRVDPDAVAAMVDAARAGAAPSGGGAEHLPAAGAADPAQPDDADGAGESAAAEVTIDDFARIDLRVARIESAAEIEGARRLLRLEIDCGPLGRRQVVAGIRGHCDPAHLPGRHVILVANLKPALLRGVESRGMILAASGADGVLRPIPAPEGARPGDSVA